MPMAPPKWTAKQLDGGRLEARKLYRKARIDEPAELYADQYEAAYQAVAELLETTVDLSRLRDALPDIIGDGDLLRALRYLCGPPISEDDLKIVAEVELGKRYLAKNPAAYDAIAGSIVFVLDHKRFPWVLDDREPTEEERLTALVSTAALAAYQKVQAIRRNQARTLETLVADALVAGADMKRVNKRVVETASDWPGPGTFCGEGKVAQRQADLIVTLFDGRYMPIEVKSSGSALNSIKRLNNDTLAKFTTWTDYFGTGQTIPVAVLEGVYNLDRLLAAQNAGAAIFWSHHLTQLVDFVVSTK